MKKDFSVVKCVASGDGFIEGKLYAQIGWNNGLPVLRETDTGDVHELCCQCFGDVYANPACYPEAPLFEPVRLLDMNEYQQLAARTIGPDMDVMDCVQHALHGMVSEIGELHALYQKCYQGHKFDPEHAKKELGDLLWFIAEYAGAMGWTLDEVAQANIEKLRARYPDGFSVEHSLHRAEGDV